MKNVAVFCGSSPGNNPIYLKNAKLLASYMANNNYTLIYGGGKVGLMGEVADVALSENGKVLGVIPQHLKVREVAHNGLTKLYVVETMHQRKKKMEELSDAFIALPGGLGTTEEIFEMLTWAQLNLHKKPSAFLNVNGYYNHLEDYLNNMVKEGFLETETRNMIIIEDNIESIFDKLNKYQHPEIDKAEIALSKVGKN